MVEKIIADTVSHNTAKYFILAIIGIIIINYGVIFSQVQYAVNDNVLHEEHRLFFTYFPKQANPYLANDYITQYYASFPETYGYRFVRGFFADSPENLRLFYKRLPLVLWVLLVLCMACLGWKIGGAIGFFTTATLTVNQPM